MSKYACFLVGFPVHALIDRVPQSGVCSKEFKDHAQPVTAAKWSYDRSGFYTGALDSNIYFYVCAIFCVSVYNRLTYLRETG